MNNIIFKIKCPNCAKYPNYIDSNPMFHIVYYCDDCDTIFYINRSTNMINLEYFNNLFN